MSWYALENIEEALQKTKGFLLPFDSRLWAKIAVIALFAGGIGSPNMPTSFGNTDTGTNTYQSYDSTGDFNTNDFSGAITDMNPMTGLATAAPSASSALIALIAVLGLGIFLAFGILSAIFTFIFYRSLLDEEVHIRRSFSRYLGKGVRLFLFQIGVMIFTGTVVVLFVAASIASPLFLLPAFFLGLPMLLGVAIFLGLTDQFVPLKMIENDSGVIPAWKELWPELRNEWRQTGLYVLMRFVLNIGVGIIAMVAMLILGLVLAVPFLVVGIIAFILFKPLAAVVAVLGVIAWLASILYFVRGPVQTYFRYYALLTYHDLTS